EQLAQQVMEMFKQQQIYFKSRSIDQLEHCKYLEGKLKSDCKLILNYGMKPTKTKAIDLFNSTPKEQGDE
ncbi:hypothetical protein RZS08_67120, partial [Arthrospira platensis SPKY1]|nr:hypothetical protein [Arthrospira platensis SPKY1]